MAEILRIAIVDNFPIFREGLVQVLRRYKGLAVVGEGATAEEAEQFAYTKKPHILIMEAAIPNSLQATLSIRQNHGNTKVIFLASAEDEAHAYEALRAGARG